MSAPDSWESLADPNIPPGQGGDMGGRFAQMNINARPFVPNIHAHPFVPVPRYGAPYGYPPMAGPHAGAPMYHQPPPGMHMGRHQPGMQAQGPYGMSQGMPPMQQPGMAPVHQSHPKPIPVSALEAEQLQQQVRQQPSKPPSMMRGPVEIRPGGDYSGSPAPSKRGGVEGSLFGAKENKHLETPKVSPPKVEVSSGKGEEATVESWEEIADGSENQPTPESRTKAETSSSKESAERLQPSSAESVVKTAKAVETVTEHAARKQPSPTLSERLARSKEGESSSPSVQKGVAKLLAPPPRKEDEKENVNIVFIGHVDAGKSTIGGHVMYLTGQVDKRTLDKYEREAKEKNRETWYLSWALDTNQEERDKGKTVEVGRASFETTRKRFTILDAPGHAGFVPNMISGAVQADIGILVISARRGEFETGFERKGQTREHAMLAKTAGVKHLVVLINKMDDPTVGWSEERYEECKTKLTPFLKKVGFNPKTDIFYIPVSGLTGINLMDRSRAEVCPWYSGPAFIPYLDDIPPLTREETGPFRLPIADKYKDMGTVVMGKVESGGVMKGASLLLMPNRVPVEVLSVVRVDDDITAAYSGDNIKLKLKGIEEEDISPGFVLCDPAHPCHVGHVFDAQIAILEYKSIICAGYSAVLHIHAVVEEVQIKQLIALVDKKTGKKSAQRPRFIKQDQVVIARLQTAGVICLETFKEFAAMARFTLRDEGKTIAIGKVLKLVE